MFPPFDEEKAFLILEKIIAGLDSGLVKRLQLAKESEERKSHGIMIGAAICEDSVCEGEKKREIILCTVSGITQKLEFSDEFEKKLLSLSFRMAHDQPQNHTNSNIPCEPPKTAFIFVEPIVSPEKINDAIKKNDYEIHELTKKINALKSKRKISDNKYKSMSDEEKCLSEKRLKLCDESLNSVFSLYSFHCADGKIRTLNQICGINITNEKKLPPTGTGDCSAPKLLDFAFKNNYKVLSLCEVFYGKDNATKVSGKKYPPCDERCGLILPSILGLKIIYRDQELVVLEKPSGLLSVPGRGEDKQDCVVSRFKRLFPDAIEQPSVHRLDMETSGLMVLARTKETHRDLNRQFEQKEVYKEYEALLSGTIPDEKASGTLELYFRLDVENRPHQIWDEVYGKKAITEYHKIREEEYISPSGKKIVASRIKFIPHTGRTHQLRLASADFHGLNIPIIGDTLYGKCEKGERLMLHATVLEFTNPKTGKRMHFESECPF